MSVSQTARRLARWSGVAALAVIAPLSLSTLALSTLAGRAGAETAAVRLPAPKLDQGAAPGMQTAVFAGGCFWGVQGVFEHVKGVRQAVSGYAGGQAATAHYEVVSTGLTGHAESVKVTYDPRQVTYGRLLQVFLSEHDPTELNRQDPDSGSQYRSEIFYTSPDQKRVAEAYLSQLRTAHAFHAPIVTKLEPMRGFYQAEAHHQDFLALYPDNPYIAAYDIPKIEALHKMYPDLYRPGAVRLTKGA